MDERNTEAIDGRISASILTGFLGSGKTTFLNKLLKHPSLSRTAVLVNEFGDVGIDDALIDSGDGSTILMDTGCICCTIRDSLSSSIIDLLLRRENGKVPAFDRMIVETTGLARPGPITFTFANDPMIASRVRLDSVLTTVDSLVGMTTLHHYEEAMAQVAIADRLILTKTDLADIKTVEQLTQQLAQVNPAAILVRAIDDTAPEILLHAGLYDPATRQANPRSWMNEVVFQDTHEHQHMHRHGEQHVGIQTFCLTIEEPSKWEHVASWLDDLAAQFGTRLLRLKGIISIAEVDNPVVIHGVQGFFHPPGLLANSQYQKDRESRIVFITHDVDPAMIVKTASIALGCEGKLAGRFVAPAGRS